MDGDLKSRKMVDYSENQFFDALEEIDEVSEDGNCVSSSSSTQFDVWMKNPESVESRRGKFFDWLGLVADEVPRDASIERSALDRGIDRGRNDAGDLLRTGLENEFPSSRSTCLSIDDSGSSGNSTPKVHFEGEQDKGFDSNVSINAQRTECKLSSSSAREKLPVAKDTDKNCSLRRTKGVKKWWLGRLRSFNCNMGNVVEPCKYDLSRKERIQRVKVHQSGKQSKELSALYYVQSIQAHRGAILTMKFSPNGQFLASAGEDRVVRVWQVIEDDRSNERDIPDIDPSSVYFRMNKRSELKPLSTDKEKNGRLKKNPESACVVLPPKVFRIMEKPLHEFQGHTSEILDLSWSSSNFLLSSSIDKTVRMWRVGCNNCLKVFPHHNYVTCVEFNPVDENHFISGSIDGKVRIWEISHCKVVYWTEIKDIVTAVCYRRDGQGGIIGSITGSCRFYSISDHKLQLDDQIFLHNKKSSGKRITGFQFFPRDPAKVMISCADSQVRVIQGVDVIGKYKGVRTTGSFSSAHFTSDGKYIVSAFDDSSVNIWNCDDHGYQESSEMKKVKSSERFNSNSSVALPWPGIQNESRGNKQQNGVFNSITLNGRSFSPVEFSCGQDFFQESYFPKGSALWPEEKLVAPNKMSSMHKSEYKFLKTCQSKSDYHAWGMVIVTAGWDGRIRSFHNYGLPVPR